MYMAHQERPPPIQPPISMDPTLPVDRNGNTGPSYPTPSSSSHTVLPRLPQSPEELGPVSCVENGKLYSLEVVQQPIRARMCGFGDKDRRPITPPPCIRLIVRDAVTREEIDISEIDTAFFVLTVDLWSADGKREVNLVRHSATSPSISAATSSSYPPRPPTPPYQTNGASSAPNSANPLSMQSAGWHHQHQLPAQQSPTQPTNGGTYGYTAPLYHTWRPPQPIPPPQSQYQPSHQQYQPQPQYPSQSQPQPYYAPAAANPLTYYGQPQQQGPLLTPDQMQPQAGQQATGMFTRNLIGSLCVSAFKLTDPDSQMGVWFILQDLSVRTEGSFRLRMNFVNVGQPNSTTALNNGSAPVLASTFSEVFQVYSAKKFPGVIESTALSKCFATQGIKIPIRKDGPRGNIRDRDDFDQDDDQAG